MLQAMTWASPPPLRMPSATVSQASALRLEITTLAPSLANSSAEERPMPRLEPVITATLPVRSNGVDFMGGCSLFCTLVALFFRLGRASSRPSCMDGPLSARLFLVFWQTDRGAVMYTASRCGPWPRALLENADLIPIMYGRPPVGKAFFGVLANGSGSGHVYGLEMRPVAAGPVGERGSNSNYVWTAPCRQGFFWCFGKRIGERSCIRPRDAARGRGPGRRTRGEFPSYTEQPP